MYSDPDVERGNAQKMRAIPGKSIVERVYSATIEGYLPRKVTEVNGVRTRKHRLLRISNEPNYEEASVTALRKYCQSNDSILVLGGGWGVTTVWAARLGADVTVYEAAKERVRTIREAVELNEVEDSVSIRHGVVGESKRLLGDDAGAPTVDPADLPGCDVVEMDIEGAELTVLEAFSISPRVIIVETHANYGAPASEVKRSLSRMDYEIVNAEDEGGKNAVLTALREGV